MGKGADLASLAGSLPPLVRASAPESGSTLMETEKQTKNFFQGRWKKGQSGASLAGSLPPLAGASAPLTPPWEKFFSGEMEEGTEPGNSGWQSPTLGPGLCPPDTPLGKNFFQGRWKKGQSGATLTGSLPPLAWASAPLTPPWEKNFFRGDGRRGRVGISGWQSPTLGLVLCP